MSECEMTYPLPLVEGQRADEPVACRWRRWARGGRPGDWWYLSRASRIPYPGAVEVQPLYARPSTVSRGTVDRATETLAARLGRRAIDEGDRALVLEILAVAGVRVQDGAGDG